MRSWKQLGLLTAACVLTAGSTNAATITFRSGDGNGAVGTADPNVTVLPGPFNGFTSLTPADFAAAQGTPAIIINRNYSGWISSLPADPAARWISTGVLGGSEPSGLYAVKLDIGQAHATDATLELYYAVDDYLGRNGYTSAIYLNGDPLMPIDQVGDYTSQNRLFFENLTLQPGENWIYINSTNIMTLSGVMFAGTLAYTPIPVPEPVSLSLLAAGGASLLLSRRRR